MNSKRYAQIKEFSRNILGKEEVNGNIAKYNSFVLANDKDGLIDDYIQKYLYSLFTGDQFDIGTMNFIISEISLALGVNFEHDVPIHKIVYSLIVENILLPDYYTGENKREEINDFIHLINQSVRKMKRNIEKMRDKKITLSIGNKDLIGSDLLEKLGDFEIPDISTFLNSKDIMINEELVSISFYYDDELEGYSIGIDLNGKSKQNKFGKFLTEKNLLPIIQKIEDEFNSIYNYNTDVLLSNEKDSGEVLNIIRLNIRDHSFIENGEINIENFIIFLEKTMKFGEYFINKLIEELEIEVESNLMMFLSEGPLFIVPNKKEQKEIDQQNQEMYGFGSEKSHTLEKKDIEKFIVKDTNISLNDIGGNAIAKEEITKIITSIKYEDIMKEFGAKTTTGIIFEGPSGTGKTMLAKVIAHEIDAIVYNIKMSDIASSAYINTGSTNVKQIFEHIREQHKKTGKKIILILDELDALFKKRGQDGSGEDTKIVNTFLTEMDGFDDNSGLIIVGTTNKYEELDQAVIRSGRISKRVNVPLPNEEERKEIFGLYIHKASVGKEKVLKSFKEIDISILAKESVGLSGADIAEVIRELIQNLATEYASNGYLKFIYTQNIVEEIEKLKKSKLEKEKSSKGIGFMAK